MTVLMILFPLAITLLIETGIYMILKHKDLKLFLVVSIMNLLLNPLMNIALIYLGKDAISYWVTLSVSEVLTILIESLIVLIFMKFKYHKILLFAFIANLVSFLIGLAVDPIYDHRIVLMIVTIMCILGYLAIYTVVFISFIRENQNIES